MHDALARAHHLDVAGLGAAAIAQMVLVADRAAADIGDDLHVPVAVHGKAAAGLDRVVVPDPQRAEAHAVRVMVVGETEMVARLEPVDIHPAQGVEGDAL